MLAFIFHRMECHTDKNRYYLLGGLLDGDLQCVARSHPIAIAATCILRQPARVPVLVRSLVRVQPSA